MQARRDLEHGPAPPPVLEVRLAAVGAGNSGAGEDGGIGHHAQRRDPGLAGMLRPEEREHGVGDVAFEHLGGPQLPLGKEAVEKIEVAGR